jgi:Fanconi-associated nuclease 1
MRVYLIISVHHPSKSGPYEFIFVIQALEVAQAMDMALEVNDMTTVMSFVTRAQTFLCIDQNEGNKEPRRDGCPSFFFRFTAARVYATVCTLGVSILEREHRFYFSAL